MGTPTAGEAGSSDGEASEVLRRDPVEVERGQPAVDREHRVGPVGGIDPLNPGKNGDFGQGVSRPAFRNYVTARSIK